MCILVSFTMKTFFKRDPKILQKFFIVSPKASSVFHLQQIYQLAKDTVVLLLECNPDVGMLLEWVIDRCYTAVPREADACFLALSSIFNVK